MMTNHHLIVNIKKLKEITSMNIARQHFFQYIIWVGVTLSSQSLLVHAADQVPSTPVTNKTINKTATTQQSNPVSTNTKSTQHLVNRSQNQLPPDSIQAIQLIGRSVLAAKHSENIDPKTNQMKQRLVALQKSIDELIEAEVEVVPSELSDINTVDITLGAENTNSKTKPNTATENIKKDVTDKQQKKSLRKQQKMATLQQRLNDLKVDQNTFKQTEIVSEQRERQPHMPHLLAMTEAISAEIEAALASDDTSRRGKLNKLRERLKVKNMGEMQVNPNQEETPTISTITQHRE